MARSPLRNRRQHALDARTGRAKWVANVTGVRGTPVTSWFSYPVNAGIRSGRSTSRRPVGSADNRSTGVHRRRRGVTRDRLEARIRLRRMTRDRVPRDVGLPRVYGVQRSDPLPPPSCRLSLVPRRRSSLPISPSSGGATRSPVSLASSNSPIVSLSTAPHREHRRVGARPSTDSIRAPAAEAEPITT